MKRKASVKTIRVVLTFAAILAAGMMNRSRLVRASDDDGARLREVHGHRLRSHCLVERSNSIYLERMLFDCGLCRH